MKVHHLDLQCLADVGPTKQVLALGSIELPCDVPERTLSDFSTNELLEEIRQRLADAHDDY